MGYLNGVTFSCSNARVNHNELRIMFGFFVPSYSPDTCLSNCMVSHPSRTNVLLQWEARISITSRQCHLLTCSQTPWQSNYSYTQQLDVWIYNIISIRFWPRFWRTWCLSPWFCHLHHPNDGGGRYSEMSVHICQTTRCHNWEYLWCQISLVYKRQTATTFTLITSVNYASFKALG